MSALARQLRQALIGHQLSPAQFGRLVWHDPPFSDKEIAGYINDLMAGKCTVSVPTFNRMLEAIEDLDESVKPRSILRHRLNRAMEDHKLTKTEMAILIWGEPKPTGGNNIGRLNGYLTGRCKPQQPTIDRINQVLDGLNSSAP